MYFGVVTRFEICSIDAYFLYYFCCIIYKCKSLRLIQNITINNLCTNIHVKGNILYFLNTFSQGQTCETRAIHLITLFWAIKTSPDRASFLRNISHISTQIPPVHDKTMKVVVWNLTFELLQMSLLVSDLDDSFRLLKFDFFIPNVNGIVTQVIFSYFFSITVI